MHKLDRSDRFTFFCRRTVPQVKANISFAGSTILDLQANPKSENIPNESWNRWG